MLTRKNALVAAIVIMAVTFIGFGLNGCATKRDVGEIKAELRQVKEQNLTTHALMVRLDSLISTGTDADKKLRNDISVTVNDLQQQIDILLENFNDMLAQMQQLGQQPTVIHRIGSSPGAQEQTSVTVTDTTTQPQEPPEPAIDCGNTYDESFILVRRGEYEKAIDGFRLFLQHCEKHESAENAYYWIGESYYALEKYVDATTEFEYLIENYKGSVNMSRAMYKLARSQQELGKNEEAKKIFERLIDEHPETLEASQARERLKDL